MLWVLDEFQPVAALLEPATGRVLELVDWRGLAPPPPGQSTSVVGDGTQIWLQPGVHTNGVVGRVDTAGLRQVVDVGETTLVAVGHGAAWCVDRRSPDPGMASHAGGRPVPPPLQEGRLVVVEAGSRARKIPVDRPVNFAEPRPDALYLDVYTHRPTAEPVSENSRMRAWSFDYHRAQLRLPWTEPLPARIAYHQYPSHEHDSATPWRWKWGGVGPWLSWHSPHRVTTNGLSAAGLRWAMGPLHQQAHGDRYPVIATGHDPHVGIEQVRIELGAGRLHAAMECAGLLWAVICRAPRPRNRPPLELLRIDPNTHQVDTMLHSEQLDITELSWPLVPLSDELITAHADYERARYYDAGRFLDEVSEVHSELDGHWPDLGVRLRFRHPHLPGGWLSRRWRIFDEIGRPSTAPHAETHLMEDLACGLLPPTDAALDGVLEV